MLLLVIVSAVVAAVAAVAAIAAGAAIESALRYHVLCPMPANLGNNNWNE